MQPIVIAPLSTCPSMHIVTSCGGLLVEPWTVDSSQMIYPRDFTTFHPQNVVHHIVQFHEYATNRRQSIDSYSSVSECGVGGM